MVVILWILNHIILSFLLLLNKKLYFIILPAVLFMTVFVYFVKPITFDLVEYLAYFSNPHSAYEPLFVYISIILHEYDNAYLTYYVFICLSLIIFIISLKVLRINNLHVLLIIPILMNSLFFILGSQNALRQFLSSMILLLAISFLTRLHSKILAISVVIFLSILASLFHNSGLLFGALILLLYFIHRYRIVFSKIALSKKALTIILGFILALLLYQIYLKTGIGSVYFDKSIDWRDYRMGNLAKFIFLLFYLSIPKLVYIFKKHQKKRPSILPYHIFIFLEQATVY